VTRELLALSALPAGFTAAQLAAKVCAMTGNDYTARQAAYDVKKPRGKDLQVKPDSTRRSLASPQAIRTITALVVPRDEAIAPILAGVGVPRRGRRPNH
jgi:hypothetical protein